MKRQKPVCITCNTSSDATVEQVQQLAASPPPPIGVWGWCDAGNYKTSQVLQNAGEMKRLVPEAALLQLKGQLRKTKSELKQAQEERDQLKQMTGYLVEELAKERSAR